MISQTKGIKANLISIYIILNRIVIYFCDQLKTRCLVYLHYLYTYIHMLPFYFNLANKF